MPSPIASIGKMGKCSVPYSVWDWMSGQTRCMKAWWGYRVQRAMVGSWKPSGWLYNGDVPQRSVLGPTIGVYCRTWMTRCNPTLHSFLLGQLVSGWLDTWDGFLWIAARFTTGTRMYSEWSPCLADTGKGSSWENFLHAQNTLFFTDAQQSKNGFWKDQNQTFMDSRTVSQSRQ